MAICAKCGGEKLTEHPCSDCGGRENAPERVDDTINDGADFDEERSAA